MSIKVYDPRTAQWIPYSSNLAKEIRVVDTEGNFTYKDEEGNIHSVSNVEDALKLMAQNMEKLSDRVEYIYENGTIGGGGGGGGGSVMPTITLTTPTSYSISTDEEVVIQYNFTSPNIGFGTANITVSGTKNYTVAQTVSQGVVRFNAGKFDAGKYTISIYVIDAGGMFSNTVLIDVACGSLQLKSNFDDSIDYTLADDIQIPYTITSVSNEPIEVTYTLDGQETTKIVEKGNHTWNVGTFETTGAHSVSISATSGEMVSNKLDYTIMIADASSMYIASNFNTTEIEEGRKIVIPYRVSMAGETRAIVKRWINNQEQSEENILLGTGYRYWQVGNTLRAGRYTFRLQAFTTDRTIESNVLEFTVDVVEGGFKLLDTVTEGAMCIFNADGKSSGASDKNEWIDKSGNNVQCTLHDFNHNSNGWDGYSLNFNGRSYAEINLAPWASNIRTGFTLDFYYKIENVGDINAKALWMKNHNTPYQGIYVDTQTVNIRSGASKIIETYFRDSSKEEVWEHVAFVVDREMKLMYIYINGIISKIIAITSGETFTFDGKILLGAGRNSNGEVDNFANCSIRSLNVYNRALTDEEVLQNYIANFATAEEQKLIYELNYGDSQIPTMSFVGNMSGMNEDEEVDMQITYNDPLDTTKNFSQDRCKVSWQGTSSLLYPIKNYTIKLRENGQDWAYTPKDEWKTETRYTLKANYMESSHANNIGGAKFFNDLIKTYHPYPSQQIDEKCRGAIDGFHIRLMINGEYQGIYTFNIDRYAYNNLGLPLGSETMSYEIGVNSDGGAGAFNTKTDDDLTWDSIRREFEYRYHYAGTEEVVTELDTDGKTRILSGSGYHDALVDLVKWTAESDDTTFRGDIAQNWSLNHLIDYYLFILLVGLVDNLGKNMVITSWGLDNNYNRVWYPQLYDADSCLGLTNDGELKYGSGIDPSTGDFNTSNSQLWVKLNKNFKSEIIARYKQLRRDGWFTVEKLMEYYNDDLVGKVGQKFYNEDARQKYMGAEGEPTRAYAYLANGTRLEYTKRWLEERINYLDSIYEHGDYATHQATLRTNVRDVLKIRLKTYSPQMVMVKFSDATGSEVKKYVSSDKWYEFSSAEAEAFKATGGVVENDKDNNLGIYGTHNIMAIEGLENLNVSHLLLGAMPKITTLELPRSKHITELNLDNNRMLQTLNLKGCTNLGAGSSISGNNVGAINLSNCTNLKYVDISGTKLTAISFSESGGALEHFDASETGITDITLKFQPYLPSVKMENCKDLTSITLQSCERLESLSVPNAKISSFNVIDCNALKTINLSNNGQLRNLSLDGCPNLETLNLAGFSSETMTELMLDTCPKLKTLDISGSSFLTYVTFAEGYNALKSLNAKNSVIQSFRFGRRADYPNYLDLSPFDLTSISFYNCPSVVHIKGIDYNGGGAGIFYNCRNLERIEGNIVLTGSMNNAFDSCTKLAHFPTMDLSQGTSASEMFWNATALTLDHAKMILSTCNKVTNANRMFAGCTNIKGALPDDFFANATKMSTFWRAFNGCTGITGLAPNLLAPLGGSLTSLEYAFDGCTGITGGISENFFAQNPNLTNLGNTFHGCTGLTDAIPTNLFANNTRLTITASMFGGCTGIVSTIPDRLFANNTKLNNMRYMFSGCTKLYGKIPNNLFRSDNGDTYALTDVSGLFNGCTGLYGDVPTNFLRDCPSLTNCDYLFANCDLSGSIPSNFFANNPMLSTCAGTFRGNSSISGAIPANIFKGLSNLSDVSYFFDGCSGIQSNIPQGLLDENPMLTKLAGLFRNCSKLVGEIPEDLFANTGNILSIAGVFQNCINLTSEIPENLFANCSKVTDMSNLFDGSYRLYGKIPENLFRNCTSVVSLASAFANCKSLGNTTLGVNDPYAVPPTLLHNCPQLRDTNNMFQMWGSQPGTSKLNGEFSTEFFEACPNLENTSYMFSACPAEFDIDTTMFQRNKALINISAMFYGAPNVLSLERGSFNNCSKLENVSELFRGCSRMTGESHPFWNKDLHPLITQAGQGMCYKDCTSLSDYNEISSAWK